MSRVPRLDPLQSQAQSVRAMADASMPLRDLAKELYINGLPLMEIASRIGAKLMTVASWKRRGNWDNERLKPDTSSDVAIQDTATALHNQAFTISKRLLCKAESLEIDKPRDAKDVAQVVASAYATARKALGLDDGQIQRHLHVHVMRDASASAKVIDVASEPLEPVVPVDPGAQSAQQAQE